MPAIALDLGEHLGYCVFEGMRLILGSHLRLPDATTKLSRPRRRYLAIKKLLNDQKTENAITTVYYEFTDWHLPARPKENFRARLIREKRNRQVQRSLGALEAMVEAAAAEVDILAVPITVHDAKRAVTRNGNASKEMIAKAILGLYPQLKDEPQDTLDAASVMFCAVQREEPLLALKIAVASAKKKKTDL